MANGRRGMSVRMELYYDNGDQGASEMVLGGNTFKMRMEYSEIDHCPFAIGVDYFRDTCTRKLKEVIVRLMDGRDELDRTTLRVPKDFRRNDMSELTVRSELVLNGSPVGLPK